MPSFRFGTNSARWAIMLLALNLNAAVKQLVMESIDPGEWAKRRMKAVRFSIINLPGRVVARSRQMVLRMARGHPCLDLLIRIGQQTIPIKKNVREAIRWLPRVNCQPGNGVGCRGRLAGRT